MVEAKVLQVLAEGRVRLSLANIVIDVVSSVPLTAGSTVKLVVKNTSDGIRLALVDPNQVGGRALVPLTLDEPAKAALAKAFPGFSVSSSTSTSTAGTTPQTNAAPTSAPDVPNVPSPPLSPEAASAAVVANAVRGAAARQTGLGPLFADLAVVARMPNLPQEVKVAAAQVLALRVPIAAGLPADMLKQAVQRSGIFMEAELAAGTPPPPGGDLKTALLTLRQVLKALVAVEPGTGVVRAEPAPTPPGGPGASAASAYASARASLASPSAAEPPSSVGHVPSNSASVPPPYRGAPTTAQPEGVPNITRDMDADDVGRVLMRDTEGALARQTLLQAASLPERANQIDPASGPRWHFEVPFAMPQGTALAQFEIARDGHAAPAKGQKSVWRARFSVDIEPLGAIHAQVALIGERAAVTLWAERPEAAARMRASAADLKAALVTAEFEPDIMVRDGAPPRPREQAVAAGRFLDRAS